MKPQTKLALKRWAVRQMRKLVWLADEWIHKQELKLRLEADRSAHGAEQAAAGKVARAWDKQPSDLQKPGKTFEQWLDERVPARSAPKWDRAGIRPPAKSRARKQRLTAAQFDSTFGMRFSG